MEDGFQKGFQIHYKKTTKIKLRYLGIIIHDLKKLLTHIFDKIFDHIKAYLSCFQIKNTL